MVRKRKLQDRTDAEWGALACPHCGYAQRDHAPDCPTDDEITPCACWCNCDTLTFNHGYCLPCAVEEHVE